MKKTDKLDAKAEELRRDVPPGEDVIALIRAERAAKTEQLADRIPLLRAIAAVQKAMPRLRRTETANTGKFSYKYIPLEDIWDTLRPLLTLNGLVVTNTMDGQMLRTHVFHVETGQSISCGFPIATNLPPQQLGSAFTYARRYALCALLQIVADKDDDGAGASGGGRALDF